MDPMCVQAANALMRVYICPGSSELSCVSNSFWRILCARRSDFEPEEEADFC